MNGFFLFWFRLIIFFRLFFFTSAFSPIQSPALPPGTVCSLLLSSPPSLLPLFDSSISIIFNWSSSPPSFLLLFLDNSALITFPEPFRNRLQLITLKMTHSPVTNITNKKFFFVVSFSTHVTHISKLHQYLFPSEDLFLFQHSWPWDYFRTFIFADSIELSFTVWTKICDFGPFRETVIAEPMSALFGLRRPESRFNTNRTIGHFFFFHEREQLLIRIISKSQSTLCTCGNKPIRPFFCESKVDLQMCTHQRKQVSLSKWINHTGISESNN